MKDGKPSCTVRVANTKVEGGVVAPRVGGRSPLATILGRDTRRVDVVLSRGGLASPFVVSGIGTGQVGGAASSSSNRNGLGLGTRVISTADSGAGGHLVANKDGNFGSASDAESVVVSIGLVKLAILAQKATNTLASRSLGGRPVSLLVTSRACIGAVVAIGTAVAALAVGRSDSVDVGEAKQRAAQSRRLNTGPTTKAKVVQSDCAIVRREV